MNYIRIIRPPGTWNAEAREVRICVREGLRFFNLSNVSIEVCLVSDREMQALNTRFRGRSSPTTILSFGAARGFPKARDGRRELGELYLAPRWIRKNSADLKLLVIHGILHLMGYTHGTKRDSMKMERKEDELLKKISNF